jgi:uncharacterized protein YbcC (UPF0753/DUF2309 family)
VLSHLLAGISLQNIGRAGFFGLPIKRVKAEHVTGVSHSGC